MNQRDVFIGALQIDAPTERAAYLDQACGGDKSLRERVDVLLAVYDQQAAVLRESCRGGFPGDRA